MIKVAEVISDTNIGGAGRLLISKIKNSNKKLFKYTVILPKNSLLIPSLKEAGAGIVEIQGCRDSSFDFKGFIEIYDIIKRLSPDILNSHACIVSRIVGKLTGVKVNLYTRHCDFPISKVLSSPIVKILIRIFNDIFSDGIIAVSYSAKRNLLLLGINGKKIKVIINGADKIKRISDIEKKKIKAGLGIPQNATVVSIFARLEDYKDHKTFLRAAKQLSSFDNVYFLIVGTGSLELELKRYARVLGIEKRVLFLGFVKDISPLINITDINVNCSIGTETSSLALSEGMGIGVPAIASDYSGNRYIVKDGINGLIFPQKDYRALAKKIMLLSQNEKKRIQLSQNSVKRFQKELNAKRMTFETEKYYISKLKERNISYSR